MFVTGINNADYEKIENYSEALKPLLLMNDSLKLKRLEWILGYPEIYRWNRNDDVYKIGVDVLYRVGDDSFNYKSALAPQPDDPIFFHTWRCKNKMEIFTCKLLKDLLEIMAVDDEVARIFTNTIPPCYTFARFSDWIKMFLDAQMEEIQRSNLGSYYEQKEKKVRAALESWDKFAVKQAQIEKENSEKKQDFKLSEEDKEKGVIEHFPNSVIYLKSYTQNLLERKVVDDIVITVHEQVCDWVYSKPTGTTNLAVPLDVFQKGMPPPPQEPANDDPEKKGNENYHYREDEREQVKDLHRGPVLMSFRVENTRKGMIKAYLSFDGVDADGEEVNFFCPKSELKCQISGGMSADLLVTSKIFPERHWGKIPYSFRYKDLSIATTATPGNNDDDEKTPKARNNSNVQINVMSMSDPQTATTACTFCNVQNEIDTPNCDACGEALIGGYNAV